MDRFHSPIKRPLLAIAAAVVVFACFASRARASQLSFISDTIINSGLATSTDHAIVFRATQGVPASGKISVVFEDAPFTFDPALDFNDMDLAVSAVSPYSGFVDRNLAAAADATDDGVLVTDPANSIVFTLSSGSGITAGSYVRILVGENASFGGAGVHQIVNPAVPGSYRVLFNTYDASDAELDYGATILAILPEISVDANTDKVNPAVLSNGMPSGTIPSNVTGVLVSLNTDTFANCRYATSSGVAYDSMTNNFDHTALGTFHTVTVLGITQGTTYNYYVRCVDFAGNRNPTDYLISFTAGDPTGTGLGGGTPGQPAAAPSSGGGGGGGAPYPPGPANPSFTMKGLSFPNGAILVLEDGQKIFTTISADSDGNFSFTLPSVTQGTHSFTVEAVDGGGARISSFTTTLTIILGTVNTVTGVSMPPSVALPKTTVAPGVPAVISGIAEPSSTVEISVTSQGNKQDPVKATAVADRNGAWSYSLDTSGFAVDTYQVKARALPAGFSASNFSDIAYLGVGQAPVPKSGSGDLNGDGKVNLVDFSIMLFHWGTDYPPADLNNDGIVNLIDFSILLFHWTG